MENVKTAEEIYQKEMCAFRCIVSGFCLKIYRAFIIDF